MGVRLVLPWEEYQLEGPFQIVCGKDEAGGSWVVSVAISHSAGRGLDHIEQQWYSGCAAKQLCDPGQVTWSLWASVSFAGKWDWS